MSFNPRARDGREQKTDVLIKDAEVSIHAPVMDANPLISLTNCSRLVSIHAPVMDANSTLVGRSLVYSFNPRARDGREGSKGWSMGFKISFNPRARDRREKQLLMIIDFILVSIHAPMMDAKGLASAWEGFLIVSIHAPVMDAKVQHLLKKKLRSFNPRARDGREVTDNSGSVGTDRFQSTRP